jgi:pimeloyl-ACP methyl ester carboxylesterase
VSQKPAALFIHGAFCRAQSLANLIGAFERAGYETYAPDLRHHTPPLERDALGALGTTSIKTYAQDFAELIDRLDEPPILVGHSMGGLIAQMLAAQGRAKALVLLAPSAPWGVLPGHWNELASGFGLYLNGHYWEQALIPTFDVASDLTLNRLPPEERRKAFEQMVPESGRAMFEIFQWWLDISRATGVAAHDVTCPVFCAAGELDTLNPPDTVRRIAARYRKNAVHRTYPGMGHWLIAESGWQAITNDALDWLKTTAAAS